MQRLVVDAHKDAATLKEGLLADKYFLPILLNVHNELFALATDVSIGVISCRGNRFATRCRHVLYHIATGS